MALKLHAIWILLLCLFYMSCKKDAEIMQNASELDVLNKHLELPSQVYAYSNPNLPAFFSNPFIKIQDNTPNSNKITNWGATLGRVLFYDTRLSYNKTISCASCHIQKFGFTDTAVKSKGFNGGLTNRHSMSLINAAYYSSGRFFWDERAESLEVQVLQPIQDALEMGMTLDSVESRLRSTEFYPILFKYAFGNSEITQESISKALAQFVRSIVSFQSPYDNARALAKDQFENFNSFTAEENLGKSIFMNRTQVNCSGCHTSDVFVVDNPRNNGLTATNSDVGVFIHTGNNADKGSFKAPSLKNSALRENFMHDGSIRGLRAVIEHYNTGIQTNPNLDPHLIDVSSGQALKMNLSPTEISALLAFLNTLTDEAIVNDDKYSNPFKP
jgi:cytochrome c peroxidase